MNIKESLELIKDSLLEERQCLICNIEECNELINTLEESLELTICKLEAIEEIEKFAVIKLIK